MGFEQGKKEDFKKLNNISKKREKRWRGGGGGLKNSPFKQFSFA